MKDDRSAIAKYLTVLIVWLVPIALMLVPVLYPAEGFVRDALVLPVIVLTLYAAFLVSPMFQPLKNVDFFDEIPGVIEKHTEERRARIEARDLLRLYNDGSLPKVYEIENPTRFQRDLRRTCDTLRAAAEWHSSNGEVSANLLERLESLMTRDEEEQAPVPRPQRGRKQRKGR
ncbi:MAG: hypothetical protein ACOC7M_01230 [Chloroflexota bacterium]